MAAAYARVLGLCDRDGFVAAGFAILTGVHSRRAAILVTAMLASFALLVHEPDAPGRSLAPLELDGERRNLAVIGAGLGGSGLAAATEALVPWRRSRGVGPNAMLEDK
jgi:hypothetical protein